MAFAGGSNADMVQIRKVFFTTNCDGRVLECHARDDIDDPTCDSFLFLLKKCRLETVPFLPRVGADAISYSIWSVSKLKGSKGTTGMIAVA